MTGAAMPKAERSRVASNGIALHFKSNFVGFCGKRTVAEKRGRRVFSQGTRIYAGVDGWAAQSHGL